MARTLQPGAGSGPHGGPRHCPLCRLRAQGLHRPLLLLFPASLSSFCSLLSAQCSLAWPLVWPPPPWYPLLWPSSLRPSSPPTSQSVTCSHPGLVLEAASVFKHSSPPGCVHLGGITGQSRVTATRARVSELLGSGASETQHSPTPHPPLLRAPPCPAQRSAGHRHLGVFVREAISEGVLWLGWPRERLAQVPQR